MIFESGLIKTKSHMCLGAMFDKSW
jgi:hypothetical protein